jgi:hypothetical protein
VVAAAEEAGEHASVHQHPAGRGSPLVVERGVQWGVGGKRVVDQRQRRCGDLSADRVGQPAAALRNGIGAQAAREQEHQPGGDGAVEDDRGQWSSRRRGCPQHGAAPARD